MRVVEYLYKGVEQKGVLQGLDKNQFSMDSLSPLIVNETITTSDSNIDLLSLQEDYMHFVKVHVQTNCGTFQVRVVQHDDIEQILVDATQQPSLKWRRALATFSGNNLVLHLPAGATLVSATITYLKYPTLLYYGAYNQPSFTYNGYSTVQFATSATGYTIGDLPVSSEFPRYLHSTIVDVAVEQLAKNLYDNAQVQYRQDNTSSIL